MSGCKIVLDISKLSLNLIQAKGDFAQVLLSILKGHDSILQQGRCCISQDFRHIFDPDIGWRQVGVVATWVLFLAAPSIPPLPVLAPPTSSSSLNSRINQFSLIRRERLPKRTECTEAGWLWKRFYRLSKYEIVNPLNVRVLSKSKRQITFKVRLGQQMKNMYCS